MKKSFQAGCDTLVNKAKALGITPKSNSPTDIATAMQSIYDTAYNSGKSAGASASKVGTAVASQVLAGYTFTNSTSVGISGTMTNNGGNAGKTFTPTTAAQSYTIPAGYHNGTSKVTVNATPTQEKSTTPTNGTTVTVTPDAGKFLSKVTVVTSTCYNNGVNAGAAAVTGNPNAYGLYTATQYSTHYTEGYNAGVAVGKVGFGILAGDTAFDYNNPIPGDLGNRLTLTYTATQTVCVFIAYAAIIAEGTLGCLYSGGTEVWKLENCLPTNRMQIGLKIVKLTAGQTCTMTAQCPVQLRDDQNMMLAYVVVG